MKNKGFTLIEMMIVVAIIAALAAIAVPQFSTYLKESRRAEGITALMELQQAQAKLRSTCRFYAEVLVDDNNDGTNDNSCEASADLTELEIDTTTENGYYSLDIEAGTASGNAYTAIASAQGAQVADSDCRSLILTVNGANPNGLKTSTDAINGGGNATTGCW